MAWMCIVCEPVSYVRVSLNGAHGGAFYALCASVMNDTHGLRADERAPFFPLLPMERHIFASRGDFHMAFCMPLALTFFSLFFRLTTTTIGGSFFPCYSFRTYYTCSVSLSHSFKCHIVRFSNGMVYVFAEMVCAEWRVLACDSLSELWFVGVGGARHTAQFAYDFRWNSNSNEYIFDCASSNNNKKFTLI